NRRDAEGMKVSLASFDAPSQSGGRREAHIEKGAARRGGSTARRVRPVLNAELLGLPARQLGAAPCLGQSAYRAPKPLLCWRSRHRQSRRCKRFRRLDPGGAPCGDPWRLCRSKNAAWLTHPCSIGSVVGGTERQGVDRPRTVGAQLVAGGVATATGSVEDLAQSVSATTRSERCSSSS